VLDQPADAQAVVAKVEEDDLVASVVALASPGTQPLCLSALQILHDSGPVKPYQTTKPISPLPPWMIS
jgi:hypothetical protein